jgi:VWFA-related protein
MRLTKSVSLTLALALPILVSTIATGASPKDATATTPTRQLPPDSSTPTLQVYSRETAVDVLVTDSKGRPVYGLKQSDFTLFEDGKPQTSRSFKEYGLAAPPVPASAQSSSVIQPAAARRLLSEPRKLPPGVYTNYEATPEAGPVNIILLDALNSSPALVDYAEEQANGYIRTMPHGTQVAIFWLSGSGLHMLQGITSDPALLLRATDTDRTDFSTYQGIYYRQLVTIDALKQIATYVSAIKGRKNLIWFTPHMPILLVRDGGYGWGVGDTGLTHRVMDTYELLTGAEVAVSPVDPVGVRGLGRNQLAMEAVAEGTGGLAYYNNNDLTSSISKAIEQGSHFYTLSYVPASHKIDGRFHKISIEVNRPGLHLVYRDGYNAEEPKQHPPTARPAQMKASMEGKAPAATQLLFDVKVQPAAAPDAASNATPAQPASNKTTFPYDVQFALPQSQIAFAADTDGTRHGSLEFDLAAYDIDGKLVASLSQTVTMPLDPEQYQQFLSKPFQFSQQLNLPVGQVSLRVGILDGVSNKVGTLEVPVFNWQSDSQANAAQLLPLLRGGRRTR